MSVFFLLYFPLRLQGCDCDCGCGLGSEVGDGLAVLALGVNSCWSVRKGEDEPRKAVGIPLKSFAREDREASLSGRSALKPCQSPLDFVDLCEGS